MATFFKFLGLLLASTLLGAVGSYVAGRIILPGMDLSVPTFWAFFWTVFVLTWVSILRAALTLTAKDLVK